MNAEDQVYCEDVLNLQVNPQKLRQHIQQKSGKNVLPGDIRNIRYNIKDIMNFSFCIICIDEIYTLALMNAMDMKSEFFLMYTRTETKRCTSQEMFRRLRQHKDDNWLIFDW
jgi:hypothetical protein